MVPSEERRGGLGSRRDKNSPRMIGFGKIATLEGCSPMSALRVCGRARVLQIRPSAKIICSTAIAADSVVWERAS